ncbi:hypothetical protein ATPR_0804 [Acetobacter tropicalis NBRC 101654]|uniref:Uncharacterized protein n=1 Tax=Acetobacter tropicalis NBRC 101654 TaxID=749388 RepID=F7VBQ5_9PROT|nr:hypothetical protein ATPR_0804 [Acetobacter tropicalis NBRC 101654]
MLRKPVFLSNEACFPVGKREAQPRVLQAGESSVVFPAFDCL